MKKILQTVLGGIVGLYFVSAALIFMPFYNWTYAQEHGFWSWLAFGELVASAKAWVWPYYVYKSYSAESDDEVKIVEYKDDQYNFAFLVPSNWEPAPLPPKGEAGEARVAMQSPKATMFMILIGDVGKSLSKETFQKNPNNNTIVDWMINHTVEHVYKKTSQDLEATHFILDDKCTLPSEAGIKWYINTLQTIDISDKEVPHRISGIHYLPFDKPYMVSMLIMRPILEEKASEESENFKNILSSFHLVGEKNISSPFLPKNSLDYK